MSSMILVYLLATFNSGTFSTHSQTVGAQELKTANMVLRGMKDNRDRLVSGVFRVVGRRKETSIQGQPDIDAVLEYFCAFDFSKDLFRFDRSEPVVANSKVLKIGKSPGTVKLPESPYIVFQEKGKFIRTPKHTFTWSIYAPFQIVRKNGEAQPDSTASPFDIRCVGQIGEADLHIGTSYLDCLGYFSDQELLEVKENDNGVFQLVWKAGDSGQFRRAIWFDTRRGYSPVRLELLRKDSEKLVISSESSWIIMSGAWVPQSCRIQESHHSLDLQWSFEWEAVAGGKLVRPGRSHERHWLAGVLMEVL